VVLDWGIDAGRKKKGKGSFLRKKEGRSIEKKTIKGLGTKSGSSGLMRGENVSQGYTESSALQVGLLRIPEGRLLRAVRQKDSRFSDSCRRLRDQEKKKMKVRASCSLPHLGGEEDFRV